MDKDILFSFASYFTELKDPRVERTTFYPLVEILFVVLCRSLCGAESWGDFVDFGEERLDFLKKPQFDVI